MTRHAWHRRSTLLLVLSLVLLGSLCLPVSADENDDRVIEADFVYAAAYPELTGENALLVQATSWTADTYSYVISFSNLSPWPLGNLYLLDRYFPPDSTVELTQSWELESLEPGEAQSIAFHYDEGPLPNACHQLELSWGEGWSAVLMDCGDAGTSTLWAIAVSEEMATYPEEEPLTLAEPTGKSKLGIHVTRNSDPAIMAFVAETQPAVVVAVGDVGWLADVKEASPDTITVGRFEVADQTMSGDPAERAREFVDAHAGLYLANPGVDYWLGWNEPGIDGAEDMAWYAAFEKERVIAMAEIGLKTAIGNFSTGTPEADEFAAFLPAVMAAKQYDGVLAVHEYSAPRMADGAGYAIPGIEANSQAGSLTLRYRYWYDTYLRHNDLVIPLIVTEAGIDGGVLSPDYDGWTTFTGESTDDDVESITLDDYLTDLDWYDNELRRDPYVLGFAVFNLGDANGEWASFDLTAETDELAFIRQSKEQ